MNSENDRNKWRSENTDIAKIFENGTAMTLNVGDT